MKIHNLTQGTAAWHAYRAQHDNASDAPAMMGCSSYKSRSELMREKATGLTAEVDAGTQRRFDDGHRFEALARPLAEQIIGQDLYPVTGSNGRMSASFDGLTMAEETAFEHKSLNATLRQVLTMGDILPLQYRIQMEQQLMVSGAGQCLFMASTWSGDDLVEELHTWYAPDLELRAQILVGWEQFHKDLIDYVPTAKTVAAVAAPVESLPAVSVRLDGQLVVASNLPEFGVALKAFIANIPAKPSTDQEFADCESACKSLKKAEDALEASETSALAQMTDVEALRRTIADLRGLARSTRLASEKMVSARKDAIRMEIVGAAALALGAHLNALNTRIGKNYMPAVPVDFAGAIKGKRSIDSIRDAVDTELARAKITANEVADRIDLNLTHLSDVNAPMFLFSDLQAVCTKAADDFAALVKSRITDHAEKENARMEAERERIRREEVARIEALQAKERREAQAAIDEQERTAKAIAEAQAKIDASRIKNNASGQPVQDARPVVDAEIVLTGQIASVPMRAGVLIPMHPSLKLGQIAERLGFTLTADFLKSLGFEPAATDRASKLYHEHDFTLICAALVKHINGVQVEQAA